MSAERPAPKVLALSGGIGGAKLDLGLYHVLGPWELAVIANTGDDFRHLGLTICPDLDTIMYTLAGRADEGKGWGVAGESWACLEQLKALGSEQTWFGLGDRDLAVHLHRSELLRGGVSLSEVTGLLFDRFGVTARVCPMSDQPVGTIVHTQDGRNLPFQRYFVEEKCAPEVAGFTYAGADAARAAPDCLRLIADPGLRAIVICPSNPFVSIAPILAVPGIRGALAAARVPIVGVSPLIVGTSVKGPLADMLRQLGRPATNGEIVAQYSGLLSGWVLDRADAAEADTVPVPCLVTDILMRDLDGKKRLAEEVLTFADSLSKT